MSNRKRYDSYRGRGESGGVLKAVIVILAVVLVLGIAALIFLQPYMIYSADGVRIELPPLPFFGGGSTPTPVPTPEPTPSQVIVTPAPTPEPTPTPEPDGLHAVVLDRAALEDGTAGSQVAAAGGNAALFDMKGDDGTLGYVSSLKLAKDIRASASQPGLNDAIQALNASELYTIARVSCFRDDKLPYYRNGLALRSESGNWKDLDRIRWSNPVKDGAREYVVGICVELAELGFDEILLDNAAYPTQGRLDRIKLGEENYTPGELHGPVEQFYAQVAEALEPYGVKLSIAATPRSVLEGADADSGQSTAVLAQYAGRVWLTLPEGEGPETYAAALEAAGLADGARALAVMGRAGERTGNWSVRPTT